MEIKCQLDATEVFIADLIACSTCFGHHYAHHQDMYFVFHYKFFSEKFSILIKFSETSSKTYTGLRVKCPLCLSDFNETSIFSKISKNIQKSNFMKIRPMTAELFGADGRTDLMMLTVAFRNSAKVLKNCFFHPVSPAAVRPTRDHNNQGRI